MVNDKYNHIGSYESAEEAFDAFWDFKKEFSSLAFLKDGRNGKRYSHSDIEKLKPEDIYAVKI
jgi:hypothetical protein